ncbi:MAG: hypothetical protein IT373_14125 [Polyangiaceae bacterium]|nr:hypothetical protein [Polyangiaceae bacterium]
MRPGNGNGGNGLLIRVPLYDADGSRTGETEAATFKGLLALAHGEGLRSVHTRLLERPSGDNGQTAIVQAFVHTNRGRFAALGDANADNTDAPFAVHAIRIAETRAIARAFRLAVNIGEGALDELGRGVTGAVVPKNTNGNGRTPSDGDGGGTGQVADAEGHASGGSSLREVLPLKPPSAPAGASSGNGRSRGRDDHPEEATPDDRRAMTDAQRRLLVRLAFGLGETKETATSRVLRALGLERLEWATRADASRAIDELKEELAEREAIRGGNGEARHDA